MPILVKGGVWTNAEDEILKAAVMKYGLNNWSRISSLLVRKSAVQCKARWYEWLDPAIVKTEWSLAEDEKLLNLSKLFPNQWRTISGSIGRTAHQCVQRYNKLLDRQNNQSSDNLESHLGTVNPEIQPAKADTVDMEEADLEMIAEARARLANTRGKKAKRKAREKLIADAKKLSNIQKNRELLSAGVIDGKILEEKAYVVKKGEIDYAEETPFATMINHGEEEDILGNKQLTGKRISEIEGLSRKEDEDRMRRDDKKLLKKVLPKTDNTSQSISDMGIDTFSFKRKGEITSGENRNTLIDKINMEKDTDGGVFEAKRNIHETIPSGQEKSNSDPILISQKPTLNSSSFLSGLSSDLLKDIGLADNITSSSKRQRVDPETSTGDSKTSTNDSKSFGRIESQNTSEKSLEYSKIEFRDQDEINALSKRDQMLLLNENYYISDVLVQIDDNSDNKVVKSFNMVNLPRLTQLQKNQSNKRSAYQLIQASMNEILQHDAYITPFPSAEYPSKELKMSKMEIDALEAVKNEYLEKMKNLPDTNPKITNDTISPIPEKVLNDLSSELINFQKDEFFRPVSKHLELLKQEESELNRLMSKIIDAQLNYNLCLFKYENTMINSNRRIQKLTEETERLQKEVNYLQSM